MITFPSSRDHAPSTMRWFLYLFRPTNDSSISTFPSSFSGDTYTRYWRNLRHHLLAVRTDTEAMEAATGSVYCSCQQHKRIQIFRKESLVQPSQEALLILKGFRHFP